MNNNSEFFMLLADYLDTYTIQDVPVVPPNFEHNGCSISFEYALLIWNVYEENCQLSTSLDKECDYNRLLRKENSELRRDVSELIQQINAASSDNNQTVLS